MKWWGDRSVVERAQLIAAGVFACALIASRLGVPAVATGLMLLVSGATFAVAFALWAWPQACKIWDSSLGKVLLGVLNLVILWMATAYARDVVASGTGLPVQNLTMTVRFFTLLLYVPAALLCTMIALGVLMVVLEVVAMAKEHLFFKYVGLMAGAMVLILVCSWAIDAIVSNTTRMYPLARSVAVLADFEPAHRYPGVGRSERVLFMDGGLIAVASSSSGNSQFVVRTLAGD